jgi:hypothetical protein
MARIMTRDGEQINIGKAMLMYFWSEIVEAMDEKTLDAAIETVNAMKTMGNWEEQVLKRYMETTETDLVL